MDLVRGSRRGPHLGLRRHVPALGVDLHLRPRLPGRPDRAGASSSRAAAATAPTSSTTTTSPRSRPRRRRLTQGPVAVAGARASGAASSAPTTTAPARPASSTAPASSSTAPASPAASAARCTSPRWRPASGRSTGSPTSAGSSRCASRSTPTTTATSRSLCGSGSGATGARAATSSTGGAPSRPTPSSAADPSTCTCETRSSSWSARRSTTLLVRQLQSSARKQATPLPHPRDSVAEPCHPATGRARSSEVAPGAVPLCRAPAPAPGSPVPPCRRPVRAADVAQRPIRQSGR